METDLFLNLLAKRKRGAFKLYIGMAAGVGKTCRMLQDAHALQSRGVNVLVGFVETHNRADTVRLTEGLPILPLKTIFYKGKELHEFDLETVLRLNPEAVIVDELAHTNVPGSKNEKRWQDVVNILEAGIPVISAVNIQHLESLNSAVERITGVQMDERVPDSVIQMADEVVNIDLPANELIQRLREGKIYAPEKAETALKNFFKEDNLLHLRELALREVAGQIDRQLENRVAEGKRVHPEKLCVLISSNEKTGRHLIRKVARLAQSYGAKWYVVYVQTPTESDDKIRLSSQRHLINNFKLATELGATVETLKSADVAQAVAQFAQENNVSLIILGKTQRNWWSRLWRGDMVRRLVDLTRNTSIDILMISAHES